MEATMTSGSGEKATTSEELAWRAHVAGAAEFTGPNAEYCRRHGLDHRVFRAYKKKFGVVKARISATPAFVKIEPVPERVKITPIVRDVSLPDPMWTAKFIAALMEARR
jgi:hypothetical protein